MNNHPSHAERQARYRNKQNARFAELQDEVTRLRAGLASRDGATATATGPLEARIRELEAELARERAGKGECPKAPPMSRNANSWKRAAGTRTKKAAVKAAAPMAQEEETAEKLRASRDALRVQLKGKNTRIVTLEAKLKLAGDALTNAREGIPMTKRLRREISWCLHEDGNPDDSKEMRERRLRALQGFNGLNIKVVDA